MKEHIYQKQMKPARAAAVRLLIACGVGLLLGELGDLLAWNQQVTYWVYLCLLCPMLLGVSAALIAGVQNRPLGVSSIASGVLAFICFYLIFVVLGVFLHPLFGGPPTVPNPCDSPCWVFTDHDLTEQIVTIGGISIVFFPIGLAIELGCFLITSSAPRLIHWLQKKFIWTSFRKRFDD